MSKVSIIIPVFNVEKYLTNCIDSVFSQTFKEWELILVDDGSTDNSGIICDEYASKDSRVKVIHKGNGGVSSARNAGINASDFNLIYFVDSDDFIDPPTLEEIINKYKATNADLVVHGLVDDNLVDKSSHKISYSTLDESDYAEIIESTDRYGLLKGPVCKLFRREIILANKVSFDSSISYGEDTKFTFDYLQNCSSIAFVPKHFYHYCNWGVASLTRKRYNYQFWENTANMLKEVRMPIVDKFRTKSSYNSFIHDVYVSHISKAIHSLYDKETFVPREERLKCLKLYKRNPYIGSYPLEHYYLNRMLMLFKTPLIMDLVNSIAFKYNYSIY